MPVKNRFAELLPEITAWRRDIHENPELLFDVHRTAAKVAGLLREFDPDRMYASWNNDTNLIVVQYHVFDKLFSKPDRIKGFGSL